MSKLWRVISDTEVEQVLTETSAELVSVADNDGKLEATTVEGALSELADGVKEARRANIIDVGQGTPTTESGNTVTPINFKFSDGSSKSVNIYAQQGGKGDTGAKIVSTVLIGKDTSGGNIYQQTFDNGTKATFVATSGGVTDYEELKSQPIVWENLNSISSPVANTYYKHTGTTGTYTNGVIYYYDGSTYKAIDGSGSGGGSGSISYTKIESTIPTSAWVSSAPSWIGQNALTWSANDGAYYIQGGTKDLGLVAGNSYTATLTIDGTDYDAENSEVMDSGGMPIYVGYFNNFQVMLQIFDHCSGVGDSGPISGNGYLVLVIPMGGTVPSSVIVKSFSGAGGISAIISNSAIKVNSAVTMYIDYNGKISAVEKASGSLTVSANAIPTVDIPYAIEISDTNTEGLFEVVNNYLPIIPETPTALPQKTSAVKTGTWTAGEEYINIFDNDITSTSDVDVNISHKGEVIGELANSGAFTITSEVVPTSDIQFTYKVKQTNGTGQINIINSYIPTEAEVKSFTYIDTNRTVKTTAWATSSVYSDYPQQATVQLSVKWDSLIKYMNASSISEATADIVFGITDALDGNYAPITSVTVPEDTSSYVQVTIYAAETPSGTLTIPTIRLTCLGV